MYRHKYRHKFKSFTNRVQAQMQVNQEHKYAHVPRTLQTLYSIKRAQNQEEHMYRGTRAILFVPLYLYRYRAT